MANNPFASLNTAYKSHTQNLQTGKAKYHNKIYINDPTRLAQAKCLIIPWLHWSDYLDGLQADNVVAVNFGGVAWGRI